MFCTFRAADGSWDWTAEQRPLTMRMRVDQVRLGIMAQWPRAELRCDPTGVYDDAGEPLREVLDMARYPSEIDSGHECVIWSPAPDAPDDMARWSFVMHGYLAVPALRSSEREQQLGGLVTSIAERVDHQPEALVTGRIMAIRDTSGESDYVAARLAWPPCVFNPDGNPNRHPDLMSVTIAEQTVEGIPCSVRRA
jgi:hypothetical protein